MARTPDDQHRLPDTECPATLAETLFFLPAKQLREELEQFRIKFEAKYGPTDLTRRYTSTWPNMHQEWLIKEDTQRYYDGLPPFAKAFIKGKMQLAASMGRLDDMPASYLKLFVAGKMAANHRQR